MHGGYYMEAKCSDRGWKEQNNDPKMYTLFLNCFDMLVHSVFNMANETNGSIPTALSFPSGFLLGLPEES